MKPGVLLVHCWGLALADFWRNPRSSDSWRARRNFLSGKQHTILLISHRPNLTKFEHNTSIGVAMKNFGTEFWKFYRKGSFFPKTQKFLKKLRFCDLGRHNSAMITHRRKFTTKITLYGISSFHVYRWNQFKVIPLAIIIYTVRTRYILPNLSDTSDAGWQHGR